MNTSNSAEWNERCNASGGPPRDTESMFHLLFEGNNGRSLVIRSGHCNGRGLQQGGSGAYALREQG
jgi:hypothetical protein